MPSVEVTTQMVSDFRRRCHDDGLRTARLRREDLGSNAPVVDVARLRKAVEWVREQAALPTEQSAWYQGLWAARGSYIDRDCGTAYCVAGYVAQLSGEVVFNGDGESGEVYDPATGNVFAIDEAAKDLLGLLEEEANALFNPSNTLADVEYVAGRLAGEEL